MNKPIEMQTSGIVRPLRQCKEDGTPYTRRKGVEQMLERLRGEPIEEVARRSEILDQQDPAYLPPEVLVHFVRLSKDGGDTPPYRTIFTSLRQRLLHRLRVQTKTQQGNRIIEDRYQADVRQKVLDRIIEMLCEDREEYDGRLDYFEINFNGAVARARTTAKRDLSEARRRVNLQSLDAKLSSEEGAEVDAALRSIRGVSEVFSDMVYRSEVISAINRLPNDEREVMLMLVEGFKIKEIAKSIGCTAKTVSARRDRARAKLHVEMDLEKMS